MEFAPILEKVAFNLMKYAATVLPDNAVKAVLGTQFPAVSLDLGILFNKLRDIRHRLNGPHDPAVTVVQQRCVFHHADIGAVLFHERTSFKVHFSGAEQIAPVVTAALSGRFTDTAVQYRTRFSDEFLFYVTGHFTQGAVCRNDGATHIDNHHTVLNGIDDRLPVLVQFLLDHC